MVTYLPYTLLYLLYLVNIVSKLVPYFHSRIKVRRSYRPCSLSFCMKGMVVESGVIVDPPLIQEWM